MQQAINLGRVRQIGYVVDDLDAAIAGWVAVGVGPWYVLHGVAQEAEFRGTISHVTASLAMANTGDLQIELIRQTDGTASIYTEFLSEGGPGVHQIAYWTDDFDAALAIAQDSGWPIVWRGVEVDGGVRYAYFEPHMRPTPVIELMELNDLSAALAKLVRDASIDWDGSDPVRLLG